MNKPVQIYRNTLRIIDQTKLPELVRYEYIYNIEQGINAIKELKVRGAPLIAIFSAYLLALLARVHKGKDLRKFKKDMRAYIAQIKNARPTAVNVFKVMKEMESIIKNNENISQIQQKIYEEAVKTDRMEEKNCEQIAENGASLFTSKINVMTICNTGFFATNHLGTALGVIFKLHSKGLIENVFALETRPLLQGARLTMWELTERNVPSTLITDGSAAFVMQKEDIGAIFTGADRIAKNGDTANKIGTLTLSVLARHFNIPFFVVAPTSTIDSSIGSGKEIPIEKRNVNEVKYVKKQLIAPEHADALNYAFDITPSDLITGIITEKGVFRYPFHFG